MNEKKILVLFLICAALIGAIQIHLEMHPLYTALWQASSVVLFYVLVFSWYHYDSISNRYKRSKLMSSGILFFPLIAIPCYLVRSRKKSQRIKALLKLFGFCVLLVLSALLGSFCAILYVAFHNVMTPHVPSVMEVH
jgi:MFS family permease